MDNYTIVNKSKEWKTWSYVIAVSNVYADPSFLSIHFQTGSSLVLHLKNKAYV